MQTAPKKRRAATLRPWLWPGRLLGRFTRPVPPGLWLLNMFAQRILGVNGQVPWMVHFTSCVTGKVTVGRNVWQSFAISSSCYVQGHAGVSIGDDTIFGPGVKIISANHDRSDFSRWSKAEPVRIGRHCWLGANAVILPGTELGDNVVVGAGAVVTNSFPNGSIVAGVPAKPIGVMVCT